LIVIGISLGGTLALIAGAKLKVDGIVAIATPYLIPSSTSINGSKILVWLMKLVSLGHRSIMKSPFSHELDAIFPTDRLSYDSFPPRILLEVNRLIAEMQRFLPNVSAPTLLIEGEGDQNGEQTAASQILEHLRAKRTKLMKVRPLLSEDTRTEEQERISTAIIQFVASLSGSKL
jgi:carboxylesterase